MNEDINQVVGLIYKELRESKCYNDTINVLRKELMDSIEVRIPSELSFEALSEWVYINGWYNERASLEIYSKIIFIIIVKIAIPDEMLLDILRILNYYGNYSNVIELASCKEFDGKYYYKLKMHLAKAYKCLGLYEKSLDIYREVLVHAKSEGNEIQTAYFLTLFAKLCDDYHQKKGLYIYYHKASFQRIRTWFSSHDISSSNKLDIRIKEVCFDSYAKAIGEDNYGTADEIYNEILSNHQEFDDSKIRILSNHILIKINKYYKSLPNNSNEILAELRELKRNAEFALRSFKNERAYSVRICQYIMLARCLIERVRSLEMFDIESIISKEINYKWIEYLIEECKNICVRYNDRKYFSYISLEDIKWNVLRYDKERKGISSKTLYTKLIEKLKRVISFLENGESQNNYQYSDIYIEALYELGNMYAKIGSFIESSSVYKMIYNYFAFLLTDIKKDKNDIETNRYIEYKIMNNEEDLKNCISKDYELLIEKMLNISSKINSIQHLDMMTYMNNTISLIKDVNYHKISSMINEIINKENDNELISQLRNIEKEFKDLRTQNIFLAWDTQSFNVIDETNRFISGLEYENLKSKISFEQKLMNEAIIIKCNIRLFHIILYNLYQNTKNIADRKNIKDYRIKIEFEAYKRDKKYVVFLHYYDNVGEINGLRRALDSVNYGETIQIDLLSQRGNGLKHIKFITNTRIKWELKEISYQEKELIIPIFEDDGI